MSLMSRLFGGSGRAAFTEPGEYRVVLQLAGPSPVPVIRELRRTTGCDLETAVKLMKDFPCVVAEGLSEASAAAVAAALQGAGARAVSGPMEPRL